MLVTHYLTHRLADCRLVNLIDVTLACEDGNSKLVEVVIVADVSDEDRVGNSLLQIWKLGLVKKLNFCSDFEHNFSQDLKLKLRQDLKLEFGQFFSADVL